MITIRNIENIIKSKRFRSELECMHSFAANIKLERPIVFLLAKCFHQNGYHNVVLEKSKSTNEIKGKNRKHDLSIDDNFIEVKYHFECDVYTRFLKDLKENRNDLNKILKKMKDENYNKTWRVAPGLLKDIILKQPNFFIWVIAQRDLSKYIAKNHKGRGKIPCLEDVCIGKKQLDAERAERNKKKKSPPSSKIINDFYRMLKKITKIKLKKEVSINTNDIFQTTFIFHIYQLI